MKMLFGVGLVVLILGVASFFVPFPKQENHGIKVGDTKIGVQTEHSERISPIVSVESRSVPLTYNRILSPSKVPVR